MWLDQQKASDTNKTTRAGAALCRSLHLAFHLSALVTGNLSYIAAHLNTAI